MVSRTLSLTHSCLAGRNQNKGDAYGLLKELLWGEVRRNEQTKRFIFHQQSKWWCNTCSIKSNRMTSWLINLFVKATDDIISLTKPRPDLTST